MMNSSLNKSLVYVCDVLWKHAVEYLIVGGTAVAFHGFDRVSSDISGKPVEKYDLDFWYNPSYTNYYKLLDSLGDMNLDVSAFKKETTPDPKRSFFRFEMEQFTIDFLPQIPGVSRFIAAYRDREIAKIGAIEISILSLEDLLASKSTSARDKDLIDIEQLKSIHKKGPGNIS